jgi:hypothetical protein
MWHSPTLTEDRTDVRAARIEARPDHFDLRHLAAFLGDRFRKSWWVVTELDATSWGDDPTFDADLKHIETAPWPGLLMNGANLCLLVERVFQTLDGELRGYEAKPRRARLANDFARPARDSQSWLNVRIIRSSYATVAGRDDVIDELKALFDGVAIPLEDLDAGLSGAEDPPGPRDRSEDLDASVASIHDAVRRYASRDA